MGERERASAPSARAAEVRRRSISIIHARLDVDLCARGGVVSFGAQREAREVRGVSVTGRSALAFWCRRFLSVVPQTFDRESKSAFAPLSIRTTPCETLSVPPDGTPTNCRGWALSVWRGRVVGVEGRAPVAMALPAMWHPHGDPARQRPNRASFSPLQRHQSCRRRTYVTNHSRSAETRTTVGISNLRRSLTSEEI